MELEQIKNLKYIDCANVLVNRILGTTGDNCFVMGSDYNSIEMRNDLEKPSEEAFIEELEKYKNELLIELYNNTCSNSLNGDETNEELITAIESKYRADAIAEYEALELTKVEKIELTDEMSYVDINNLTRSLKNQELFILEKERREDLQARLDVILPFAYKAITNAGFNHVANLKYWRNVVLVGDSPKNEEFKDKDYAEQWLSKVEAEVPSLRAEKEAKDKEQADLEAASNLMKRCEGALKFIISTNRNAYKNGLLGSTEEEVNDALDALEFTFADIVKALQGYRPSKAIRLINEADFTDSIYTQDEINKLISILQG